jgi:hypothetical protein
VRTHAHTQAASYPIHRHRKCVTGIEQKWSERSLLGLKITIYNSIPCTTVTSTRALPALIQGQYIRGTIRKNWTSNTTIKISLTSRKQQTMIEKKKLTHRIHKTSSKMASHLRPMKQTDP